MRKQENKACTDAATSTQAIEEKAAEQAAFSSHTYFTAEPAPRQYWQIAEFLGQGAENAVTAAELAVVCSFRSRRQFRRQVERERRQGALILADAHGFYLPSRDPIQARREVERFVRMGERKSKSLLRTLKPARLFLQQCEGQTQLSEVRADATP